jgi:hypothetical protein
MTMKNKLHTWNLLFLLFIEGERKRIANRIVKVYHYENS